MLLREYFFYTKFFYSPAKQIPCFAYLRNILFSYSKNQQKNKKNIGEIEG